jgi:hypothetical protein
MVKNCTNEKTLRARIFSVWQRKNSRVVKTWGKTKPRFRQKTLVCDTHSRDARMENREEYDYMRDSRSLI